MIRRFILAAAAAVLTAGLGAAAPAMAQCTTGCSGSGSVSASLTIPTTFTFSVTTSAITFTGTPGGASNAPTVAYQVTTNDAAGYSVSVQPGSNLVGQAQPSNSIPVSDIAVWGPAQHQPGSANPQPSPVGPYYPVDLSTAKAITTESSTTASGTGGNGATSNYTDTYAFLGSAMGFTDSLGNPIGFNIPSAPADTYSATLSYLGLAG